jgi:hypothetical protein
VSSGLIGLVATSTAAGVIGLAWLLSKLVRTVVGGTSDREPPAELPATLVAPHIPPRRSVDVKYFRHAKVEPSEGRVGEQASPGPGPEAGSEAGSAAYRHVGEEVAAVLTAAEDAAAQIREAALRDAEQTRRAADEQAAAMLAEAQARRAEADSYGLETRAAADAYVEETRRAAGEEAARRVSEAEEQARLIRAEAEQKASDLEAEATRGRDALTKSAEAMETRLESVLTTFGRVTAELEELLPAERRSRAGDSEPADERRDDALEPAWPRGQPSSQTDW